MSKSRCLTVVSFLRKPYDWECKSQDPGSHQVEDYRKHPIESAILFHKFTLLSPSTSKSGFCWQSIQLKNRNLMQDTPRFIHISRSDILWQLWCVMMHPILFALFLLEFSYHPGLDPPRINCINCYARQVICTVPGGCATKRSVIPTWDDVKHLQETMVFTSSLDLETYETGWNRPFLKSHIREILRQFLKPFLELSCWGVKDSFIDTW